MRSWTSVNLLASGCCLCLLSCVPSRNPQVVIYTSVDQPYAEAIFAQFEQETGIDVQPLFDTEAAKVTGLVNRLLAERERPQADVFWNGEIAQTILLKKKDIFQPYKSPSADNIPADFKDPQWYWTGFAGRARVIIYNKEKVAEQEAPRSISDLASDKWRGEAVMAYPLFGTSATEAAALFTVLGAPRAKELYKSLRDNGVRVVDGNAVAKDKVAQGEAKVGLTDTDDALAALRENYPVGIVFPDQADHGTLLVPNTVGLVAAAPHPEAAKRFIDFLLSEATEKGLIESGASQIPLRDGITPPQGIPPLKDLKTLPVNYEDVADALDESARFLQEVFIR